MSSVGRLGADAGRHSRTSSGIFTAGYIKDPTDPQFQKGKEWDDWVAWMKKYHPDRRDCNDNLNVYGYTVAQTLVQVLKQAGDNLTRENIMKQAASLDMTLPMLLPGVEHQDRAGRLLPDRARAADEVRRQDLAAVRQGLRAIGWKLDLERRRVGCAHGDSIQRELNPAHQRQSASL